MARVNDVSGELKGDLGGDVTLRKRPLLQMADLFCGAGGTTEGAIRAAYDCGWEPRVLGVNHWKTAVRTHAVNHPAQPHPLCKGVDQLNPRELYKPGELKLLWASPECTHHSVARGGRPINDQSRATAWCVVRFADALMPPMILVENVPEFVTWGRVDKRVGGKRVKESKGSIFRAWVGALKALGYRVDWRVLCAADYGDPTTRRRLFVQAVRGRKQIVWPEATHGPKAPRPWVAAREIIDWSLEGTSIFDRKKPLVVKTMRRILTGFERFALDAAIAGSARDAERPLSPVMTSGAHHAAVGVSFLVQMAHGDGRGKDGSGRRVRSVGEPLPTVCGQRGDFAKVTTVLLGQQSGAQPRPVDDPAPTISTAGAVGKVDYIINFDHQGGNGACVRSADAPLSTQTTKQRHLVLSSFLVKYYGTAGAADIEQPAPTVTTKDRFSVVQARLVQSGGATFRRVSYAAWRRLVLWQTRGKRRLTRLFLDWDGRIFMVEITHRMLQVRELASAQGFPLNYVFTGTKTEQVKQIGNAVPCGLARALVRCVLGQHAPAKGAR